MRVVTSTKEVIGPQAVNHLNQFTSVTFNFNLLPNVAIGDATKAIEDAFAQIHPQYPTVQGIFQGETLVFRQLFRSLPMLLLAAVFVMYVILGILYESYVHPFTVLFPAIVPAVVGGLATLYIFHSVLSLYSVIGLFLLLGIVKKNGIMVVDFALQRIDEGWDLRSAIHEASVERFRPIMMTTLAALMGAIPIALGFGQDAASRRPLGLVIVGGLIFSQLVTLFVTPVIYLWLEWFQEHVLDKVPFLRSAHYHEHEAEPPRGQVRPEPVGARYVTRSCSVIRSVLREQDARVRRRVAMRAMVLDEPKRPLKLRDVPKPKPGRGQLLVRVSTCAVCRTDLHVVDGELPNPKLPLILGHQIVGRVEEIGKKMGRDLSVPTVAALPLHNRRSRGNPVAWLDRRRLRVLPIR